MENNFHFPDMETCRKYLDEAKKIDSMPEEETEVVQLDLGYDAIKELNAVAKTWNVTPENVVRAIIIAIVKENEEI